MAESFSLRLIEPSFKDPLTDLILELDHQRTYVLGGSTPPSLFFQLKELFHILETLGSARIEGNRTTIAEVVDRKLESPGEDEKLQEIQNIEAALLCVEADASGYVPAAAETPHVERHLEADHNYPLGDLVCSNP